MRPPRAVTRSTAYFRNWSEAAPFHFCRSAESASRYRHPPARRGSHRPAHAGRRRHRNGRESRGVRYADAADHQVIAVAEGVNVVAGAGSDIAEQGLPRRASSRTKSSGVVSFMFASIAFKGRNRQSRPFGERRIVGEIVRPSRAARRWASRIDVEAECLRRLRDPQAARAPALLRRFRLRPTSLIVSATGMAGTAAPVAAGRIDRARNQGSRNERPCRVVNQHDVGLRPRQRLEPGMHRRLARRAAFGGRRGAAR